MKKELLPSIILSISCMVLLCIIYPLIIWLVALVSPNKGDGFIVKTNSKYYYRNIGQKFNADNYFWSRPSAVDYNANGSGGSNKGPANEDFLKQVSDRADTFLVHNPGIKKSEIPVDLVTASGSGLDPHISIQAATIQIQRVAKARCLDSKKLEGMVQEHIEKPAYGMGPQRINVLSLNLALDNLK